MTIWPKYRILFATSAKDLEEEINELSSKGYEVQEITCNERSAMALMKSILHD